MILMRFGRSLRVMAIQGSHLFHLGGNLIKDVKNI